MAETYAPSTRHREEAEFWRKKASDMIAEQTHAITERCQREIRDAELTKELAAAQVQALVLRVAELTSKLDRAEAELRELRP